MKKWLVYLFLSIITLTVTYKDTTSSALRTSSAMLSRSRNIAFTNPLSSAARMFSTSSYGRLTHPISKPLSQQQSSSTSLFTSPIQQQGLTCPPSSNREMRGLHSFSGPNSPFVSPYAYTDQSKLTISNPLELVQYAEKTYFYDPNTSTFDTKKLKNQGKTLADIFIELSKLEYTIRSSLRTEQLHSTVQTVGALTATIALGTNLDSDFILKVGLDSILLAKVFKLLGYIGELHIPPSWIKKIGNHNSYQSDTITSLLRGCLKAIDYMMIDLIRQAAKESKEELIQKKTREQSVDEVEGTSNLQAAELLRAYNQVTSKTPVYTILGANEKISNQDLELLYKKWLLQHHPDKYTYSEKLKKIANEVLMYLNGYFRPAKRSNLD